MPNGAPRALDRSRARYSYAEAAKLSDGRGWSNPWGAARIIEMGLLGASQAGRGQVDERSVVPGRDRDGRSSDPRGILRLRSGCAGAPSQDDSGVRPAATSPAPPVAPVT